MRDVRFRMQIDMDPTSGDDAPLAAKPTRVTLAWTPDGRAAFFQAWREPAIWTVSLEDRVSRRVVDLAGRPGTAGQFALEVGREHIYFVWNEDVGDIWVMDVVPE